MQLTRRDILAVIASAGALALHPKTGEAAQAPWQETWRELPPKIPGAATRDEFASQINQIFRVDRPGQTAYGLSLAAVQDAAAALRSGTTGSQYSFTAVFVGPATDPLPEGTYDVLSPAGSSFSLFLKVGQVAGGLQHYESPFNNTETPDRAFATHPKTAS